MSPPIDDEDLSLSISHSQGRRNSREPNGAPQALNPNPRIPSQPAKQSKQGERLGQYNIVKTLGEGSFGKVKLANHHISGQKVALKIMSRRKLVTRDMAGRIEREIQYLQLLRHPHIIKLYTVITLPSEIVMVLEYAGGELFDYIVTHGKMAEDKARKFFQQIVCAVEYCHRHKIVHRDLKPENLLLDENLNVKIADFGLSNIMTDGNFLKTSCGSPNYAAPEVISGKLYAGPEVDVWSCGVILYVLLVGRLPFDDEYIPALFKKIASGNYMLPNYLSSGAKRLIGRMLQVNPVNRITIQDIRQDPWFMKDLADYLQPPVEDFLDTGVDPNKAIDPHALAKGKPVAVQERMHASIVGKLGKTMGYAPDDVQEALAMDEPSAIKDAYLIVRENHLMKNNPSLAADQPAFVAQSPPAISSMPMSPNVKITSAQPTGIEHPRHGSVGSNSIKMEARSPASTIAVLPSSLPDYHKAFMKGQVHKTASQAVPEDVQAPKTKEEQEARIRALKPHSRSSTNVRSMGERPEPLTSIPEAKAKKPKQQKWQFGIRSRNTPCEAMLAIYRALAKMGASWEVPRPKDPGAGSGEGSPDRDRDRDRNRQREGSQSPEYSDSDPEAGTDPEYATHEEQEHRRRMREQAASNPRRGRERYGRWNDYGYDIPEDPWVINARFRKDDMFPPGVAHPSSNHSSRADLHSSSGSGSSSSEAMRRNAAAAAAAGGISSSISSAAGSAENVAATGPPSAASYAPSALSDSSSYPKPTDSVWVYVTIQLYSIEKDFYLVDFKCAGYERLLRRLSRRRFDRSSHASDADLAAPHTSATSGAAAATIAAISEDEPLKEAFSAKKEEAVVEAPVIGPNGFIESDFPPESPGEQQYDDRGEELFPAGRLAEEKEISSPFPFLDVASRLIIQLAEAHD